MMRIILLVSLFVMAASSQVQAATLTYPAGTKPTSLPATEKLTYSFEWMGIRLGRGRMSWIEDDTSYKASISVKTSGIARMVNKQKRYVEMHGDKVLDEDGSLTYIPRKAIIKVVYPHKQRVSELTYNTQGNITETKVTPPDNRKWRPDVAQEDKDSSLDYFTGALAFHLHALTPNAVSKTSQTFYDGRRLTTGIATQAPLTAKERRDIGNNASSVIKYNSVRELTAGYTKKEINKAKKRNVPVISFINPKISRFPLYLYAHTFMGKVTATAVRE